MYQKVKAYVKEWQMLEKDDIVIAGVSGGADSVCLLFMLSEQPISVIPTTGLVG